MMKAWLLHGAGADNFGVSGQPEDIPVPKYGDDELLMKVEAVGLCFSDVKLIKAGEKHPRVIVDDLRTSPIIPGHEAVLKAVGVGKNLTKKFKLGQRFIIQADIYVDGVNLAYGYAINGGMAQYSVMTEHVLNGDEGCYLLPISEKLSAAEAALIEPWACVIAAYRIRLRTGLKHGGILRIVGDGSSTKHSIRSLLSESAIPSRIVVTNIAGRLKEELDAFSSKYNVPVEYADELDEPSDDIIIVGKHSPADVESLTGKLAANGILCLAGDYSDLELELDIGRIHYSHWRYVGTTSGDLSDAYKRNERNTLQAGGVALFPGGAGAMGQMHVQLALEGENSRRKIVVTDTDDARLRKLEKRMRKKAEAKGIDLVLVNPEKSADEDAFLKELSEEAEGGFDDIVILVPVSSIVSNYAKLLGSNGLMNIFAGIPAGSNAKINVEGIVSSGHRYIGSSGSNMVDIRYTLQLTEERKLSPVYALAAIGGMNSLKEALEGLMQARFPGKTVIYPNALEMPLVPVEKVESICPGAGNTLIDNEILTKKTEEMVRFAWE